MNKMVAKCSLCDQRVTEHISPGIKFRLQKDVNGKFSTRSGELIFKGAECKFILDEVLQIIQNAIDAPDWADDHSRESRIKSNGFKKLKKNIENFFKDELERNGK